MGVNKVAQAILLVKRVSHESLRLWVTVVEKDVGLD